MRFTLVSSEPVGALVKSRVETGGKTHDIYHFDLPPDETGIFSVALTLATQPEVRELPAQREQVEPMELTAPTPLPAGKVDEARAVAAKLNRLGRVSVEVTERGVAR